MSAEPLPDDYYYDAKQFAREPPASSVEEQLGATPTAEQPNAGVDDAGAGAALVLAEVFASGEAPKRVELAAPGGADTDGDSLGQMFARGTQPHS